MSPSPPPPSLALHSTLKRTLSRASTSSLSSVPPSPPPVDPPIPAPATADLPPPRKRAKKEKEPTVFPSRNTTSNIRIGAHVSAAGGVQMACDNAANIGARSFALFLKNQRQWSGPPLPVETVSSAFPDALKTHNYDSRKDILPHGSYLVNHANPDADKREKSYECFLDDLKRCESLGIAMYNFHPGSAMKQDRSTAIGFVAEAINRALGETKGVTIVLENMAGQGDVLGSRAEDLRDIIALVVDQTRVGVCVDTCHLHSSSLDNSLSPPSALHETLTRFFTIVPPRFLRALHVNDSKFAVGLKKDRHENLGFGHIGLEGFWGLLRWKGMDGSEKPWSWEEVVWILETPNDGCEEVWKREIELLHELEVLEDPSLIPEIQACWRKECSALKAAFASKSKTKTKKKATSKKTAANIDEEEDEHDHGEKEGEEKPAKVSKKPRATKKTGGKTKKEEESYGED
ncbi:xylose isomerase-like protein [Mrakia frigida]|uniref:DNA-(apurinic or apyrimidinic site) lyase APN1 n=1 Tax=Mrakia frigida TaxID=29902 RepID=UPI003FCC14EE